MAGLGPGDQSWGCSSGRARAPAQPVALPLWGSFPWCQGPCLGSSWPGSVPHIRISALTRGSSGWGEVFLSRCCCHPFSSWAGKNSCPRCFHTRRILDQKKRQEIFTNPMVPCWSDCSGLLRALPHQPAETRPPSSFSPSECTS